MKIFIKEFIIASIIAILCSTILSVYIFHIIPAPSSQTIKDIITDWFYIRPEISVYILTGFILIIRFGYKKFKADKKTKL